MCIVMVRTIGEAGVLRSNFDFLSHTKSEWEKRRGKRCVMGPRIEHTTASPRLSGPLLAGKLKGLNTPFHENGVLSPEKVLWNGKMRFQQFY